MQVIHSSAALQEALKGKSKIAFVPTMGNLHAGHIELVNIAKQHADCVVVSIFVNPTQFNNPEDLNKYPRTLAKDVLLLETLSKTEIVVYAPTVEAIYGAQTSVESFDFGGIESQMEGQFRPGHFDGVGTIVKRLFEIVKPDVAYFGEKDFQQLQIVKKMVEITQLPVKIKGCPIERAANGLALSSRNSLLSVLERENAALLYKTLQSVKHQFQHDAPEKISEWVRTQFHNHELLRLEYFQISDVETLAPIQQKNQTKHYRAFIAVFARDVRLIDNIALN